MLNMGWDGDRCFVMYGFVKQADPFAARLLCSFLFCRATQTIQTYWNSKFVKCHTYNKYNG